MANLVLAHSLSWVRPPASLIAGTRFRALRTEGSAAAQSRVLGEVCSFGIILFFIWNHMSSYYATVPFYVFESG